MKITLHYDMQEIQQSMDLLIDSVDDLQPILRRFSAYKRGNVKAIFAAQGPGWKPLAPSSIEKLEHTRTDKITAQGKLRSSYLKNRRARLQKSASRGNLANKQARRISTFRTFFDDKAALKKQQLKAKGDKGYLAYRELNELDNLYKSSSSVSPEFKTLSLTKKKLDKLKNASSAKKRSGKKAIEKHKLLGKLSSSIQAQISKSKLVISSKVPWSEAQNAGATVGHNSVLPARTFLELTEQDLKIFAKIAEEYMLEKSTLKAKGDTK